MSDLLVRDVPDEVIAGLDARAFDTITAITGQPTTRLTSRVCRTPANP
jgi:hypothetical protein